MKDIKEEELSVIPWTYERSMARMERVIKWLVAVILFLILALIFTNGAWLFYESSFETTQETKVEQDISTGDGDAIISGIGDINYGTDKTENNGN